ncbi:MAG TPA: tetratricopeptide repeat protein [Anaeromyxobacteraceae bacterium]|nr:tetratricopeptide repeat protein [Anaeromyxobacteraceae bacterium]
MQWLLIGLLCLGAVALILGERLRRRRVEARAYLQGVRYVLSDDPDAAIEALSNAARLGSPEAFETYLALGALFRRTGDLAHAIRLHRNMLFNTDLLPEQRTEVERELAQDYRRGGMLEDSANAFRALAERGDRTAAEGLRDVLADQGKLAEAAEVQRGLSGGVDDPILAHLVAAQARQEIATDPSRAIQSARAAIAAHPRSADALLALAEAEGAARHVSDARAALATALEVDPGAALLAWPALVALGDVGVAMELVESLSARHPGDAALHFLRGRLLHAAGRNADAAPPLRQALDLDTTGEVTLAMRDLLREASTPGPEELAVRHDLMVAALLRRARPVRCRRCGAEAPVRAWRCTRCGAFESFAQGAA